MVPKFNTGELNVVARVSGFMPGTSIPVYDFPIPPKEAYLSIYQKKPIWQITDYESRLFSPSINPDNIARAFAYDGNFIPGVSNQTGGKDMFGIDWEYVPQAGGSMVRPGKPFLQDANEWASKVVWPNIDAWDWEENAKVNENYLSSDLYNVCWLLNGWFERLISMMDFEGATVAMIDEDQIPAVKAFFDKLSDFYIRLLDKYLTYFPQIDGFNIHDDWGSQKETFFSPATAEEMIVPYMKRVTDYLHARGKFCELHSCGQLYKQVPNMIKAGWDAWSGQPMNDTHKIYEEYGDKIIIGVIPDMIDPCAASEEEQRAAARDYANKFCRPEKPSVFNFYGGPMLTDAFREELYKQSRINYGKEVGL